MWLFLAIIYDGIFLLLLMYFQEYPLEDFALAASVLNPIDLSRTLILLKLDISALLGYTGAVFKSFFGTTKGSIISFGVLLAWVILPVWGMLRLASKKDF
jgi:Cu-processing system permease protein